MKSFVLTAAAVLGLASAAAGAAAPVTPLETVQVRPSAEQRAEQEGRRIVTLPAVQVRPSAEQIAQREAAGIPTLAAVEVRPSAEQLAERDAIVTLATVQVRPSAEQVAALRADALEAGPRAAAAGLVRRMVEAALLKLPTADLELATEGLRRLAETVGQAALDAR